MKLFFALFWGLLCASALQTLGHNIATSGPLWRDAVGLLIVAWTGGNSWLWWKDAQRPASQAER